MAAHIQFTRSAGALRSALAALPDVPQNSLEKLTRLSARQNAGMLHLAVLGQFKRGKSTLVNALVGAEVLPTSAVPLTAIPTLIRYGERFSLSVEFRDDRGIANVSAGTVDDVRTAIAGYATEKENPNNRPGVSRVDLAMPVAFLERGIVLIDTPGVGSTYTHNTETTLRFLEQCDAALFVLSSDPPITASEIEFLRRVKNHVEHLIFVLNKVDYLSEKERAEVIAFVRSVIYTESQDVEELPFFPVSAREGLEARLHGNADGWSAGGLTAVSRRGGSTNESTSAAR